MPASREVYAARALDQVPRLLGNLDRNPLSPTYGCFHRDYWLDKTSDFPDAVRQFAVQALALVYRYDFPGSPYRGNPRILAPKAMGHEFTGLLDTVGKNVTGFSVGDRVVMATSVSCGECYYCRQGWTNLCVDLAPMGFTYEGGMAEYVTIPARALANGHAIKVPEGVEAAHAALSEPLSCAVNSCENAKVQKGDTVVVVGAGPMGIMNACVARELGAAKIILAEINPARLQQAEPFGFDLLVNPAEQDLAEVVKEQTDGIGADVAIVAAPAAAPQEQAPALVRKRGTVCLFASLPAGKSEITLDSRIVHYGEICVVGTSDSTPKQVARTKTTAKTKDPSVFRFIVSSFWLIIPSTSDFLDVMLGKQPTGFDTEHDHDDGEGHRGFEFDRHVAAEKVLDDAQHVCPEHSAWQ